MQSTVNENRTIHKLKLTFSIDVLSCSSFTNSRFPCRKWFMHMYIVKRDITDIVPCTIIDAVYSNDGFSFSFSGHWLYRSHGQTISPHLWCSKLWISSYYYCMKSFQFLPNYCIWLLNNYCQFKILRVPILKKYTKPPCVAV